MAIVRPVRAFETTASARKSKKANHVHTFYFDKKDGVPVRDRVGKRFRLNSEAIEYSKTLAAEVRSASHAHQDLTIVVIDESGREVHREPVLPATSP
jgi:hypothetical protein